MKLLWAAVALAVLSGCNPQDASELKQDTGKLAETAGKVAESAGKASVNAGLAAKVNSHLLLHKGVDISGLHIEADKGHVTVSGHVGSAAEKQRVLVIVRDTAGVEKMTDSLRVEK